MSDLLVRVVQIDEVLPHPNADKLEIVKVGGWQIVSGKGNYQAGQTAVHIPPDAMLPKEWADTWAVTPYLSWRTNTPKGRVKVAKLRGAPSYGFLAPNESGAEVGTDLAVHYGIEKYEEVIPIGMQAGQMARNHPLFHMYTNIQNLRNYPDALNYGDPLIVTEKIHGCVPYNTTVHMADGSKKAIIDVVISDVVLGMNEGGGVIPTKVTNIFNNGKAEEWMSLEGPRRGAGRGNHYFSLKCTPNHKVWCHAFGMHEQGCYRAASEVQVGDCISLVRSELSITPLQEQVLLGKMLGDASLSLQEFSASIDFGHKQDHEEYLHWTMRGLGDLCGNQQKNQTSGYGTTMCRARTISSVLIREAFEYWYVSGSKQVPANLIGRVGPIALAFWYMDDGSLAHHDEQEDRVLFATCGFDDVSIDNLRRILLGFGILATAYKSDNGKYNRLRLNSDDAEKFFLLIAPYVPPIMQYKLPERYRGHPGWLPESKSQYKPILVEQQVTAINRRINCESSRYDIETETHNFFANGILVHNSNSRVGWVRTADPENGGMSNYHEKVIGTHRTQRKVEDPGVYGLPFEKYGEQLNKLMDHFVDSLDHRGVGGTEDFDSFIIFGEIYGIGVQDLTYGTEKDWRVFDIAINGKYIGWEKTQALCEEHGLPIVPTLKEGFFTFEQLCDLAEGQSILSPGQIKEGIVVRPMGEKSWCQGTLDPNPKRMIFKLISSDYMTRKGGTEHH